MATEAQIQAKLFFLLGVAPGGHGTSIDVLKLDATGAPNVYGKSSHTYDPAVVVPGRGIPDPTVDMISEIGSMEDEVDIAFLFSRQHLLDAFPALTPPDWITVADRIGFEGQLYEVVKVHPTGKAYGNYMLIVALAVSLAGDADRPYP